MKEYKENEEIRKFIRKLFALPFLPPRDMRFGLTILMESEEANMADVKILDLLHYVKKQWFRNSVWKPQDICAYRRLVRTNNDVEGYHRRLNQRVELDHPPVYKLLEVLWKEAMFVVLTAKLVSSGAVRMERKKKSTEKQARLEYLWSQNEASELTIEEFLDKASAYAPSSSYFF